MTSKEFALLIEQKVKDKSITHMDAVIEYCDEKKLETDQINHLINRSLKEKISPTEIIISTTTHCLFLNGSIIY